MSIGVGFLCQGGIVFCADRQVTSVAGYKYERRKIFYSTHSDWSVLFCYAGSPDSARIMFDKITDEFVERLSKRKGKSPKSKTRDTLEDIFRHRDSKGLQTLIGLWFKNVDIYLFRTSGHKVVNGLRETIGIGDSSALEYLCDFLPLTSMDTDTGKVLGSYVVSVANRFVDGCSGGPDVSVLRRDGTVVEYTHAVMPNQKERFLYCEEEVGGALRSLLLSGGTKKIETREAKP
jgi:proteasome subunit B (beta)-like protein